jgi:hypothetical protein
MSSSDAAIRRSSRRRDARRQRAAGLAVHVTELDMDVLPRDPDMWGADLSKKAAIKAKTNIYPDGLPAEMQQKLAKRYADVFAPLLWDRGGHEKPAFAAVVEVLRRHGEKPRTYLEDAQIFQLWVEGRAVRLSSPAHAVITMVL